MLPESDSQTSFEAREVQREPYVKPEITMLGTLDSFVQLSSTGLVPDGDPAGGGFAS